MASSPACEPAPQPGEKRAPVAVKMGRPSMAVMPVLVFLLSIALIPCFVLIHDAVRIGIFGIVSVRVEVLMEMGMAVARYPMGVPVLMDMAMGMLVLIITVMVILLFHGTYFSLLNCTSSERYSALSASVV
jgi:hypothetical protein